MIRQLRHNYRVDKISSILESISFVCFIIASSSVAILAQNPPLAQIYPIYMLGALCQALFAYRKRFVLMMCMSSFFFCIDIIGLLRALGYF